MEVVDVAEEDDVPPCPVISGDCPPLPPSPSFVPRDDEDEQKSSSQVAPAAQPKENAAESAMSDVRILLVSMVLYYHVDVDVCTILEEFFTARHRSCGGSDPMRW